MTVEKIELSDLDIMEKEVKSIIDDVDIEEEAIDDTEAQEDTQDEGEGESQESVEDETGETEESQEDEIDETEDTKVDEKGDDSSVSDVEEIRRERDELRAEILRLSASMSTKSDTPSVKKDEDTSKPTQTHQSSTMDDFISAEEYDDAMTSKTAFNRVLQKVYQRATEDTKSQISDISSVKEAILQEVENRIALKQVVTDFYSINDDLKPYSSYVGTVADELQASKEYDSYKSLMEDVEKEVRGRLKISKPKPKIQDTKVPPKVSTKGTKKSISKVSEEERDLMFLLEED